MKLVERCNTEDRITETTVNHQKPDTDMNLTFLPKSVTNLRNFRLIQNRPVQNRKSHYKIVRIEDANHNPTPPRHHYPLLLLLLLLLLLGQELGLKVSLKKLTF